jgi:hypothetical protein
VCVVSWGAGGRYHSLCCHVFGKVLGRWSASQPMVQVGSGLHPPASRASPVAPAAVCQAAAKAEQDRQVVLAAQRAKEAARLASEAAAKQAQEAALAAKAAAVRLGASLRSRTALQRASHAILQRLHQVWAGFGRVLWKQFCGRGWRGAALCTNDSCRCPQWWPGSEEWVGGGCGGWDGGG